MKHIYISTKDEKEVETRQDEIGLQLTNPTPPDPNKKIFPLLTTFSKCSGHSFLSESRKPISAAVLSKANANCRRNCFKEPRLDRTARLWAVPRRNMTNRGEICGRVGPTSHRETGSETAAVMAKDGLP